MSGSAYGRFLSRRSVRRAPTAIRALQPLLRIPGMISLGGGDPNPALFPIKELEATLVNGSKVKVDGEKMLWGLKYSPSFGVPGLCDLLKQKIAREHSSAPFLQQTDKWNVCVTTGSQDALAKTFDMLLDEDSTLLLEDPTYCGALGSLNSIGANLEGVPIDHDGIVPEKLEAVLKSLPKDKKPKALYTIPTGQNPSGSTLSALRKRQIYELACEHDFLILEDDPYFYLYLEEDQPDSFFSMDYERRVLRFDSLSKVVSSGLRCGWATGPTELIQQLQLDQQATCLHPSGVSQALVWALLEEWGEAGWDAHVKEVKGFYRSQRNDICELADKHLVGLAEWSKPSAGMFLWMACHGIESTDALIKEAAAEHKVLFVPGAAFSPSQGAVSNTVRASYSTATKEQMDEALSRLATILKSARR